MTYPINHHVLADINRAPRSDTDFEWVLESLNTMCNSYEDLLDEFEAFCASVRDAARKGES